MAKWLERTLYWDFGSSFYTGHNVRIVFIRSICYQSDLPCTCSLWFIQETVDGLVRYIDNQWITRIVECTVIEWCLMWDSFHRDLTQYMMSPDPDCGIMYYHLCSFHLLVQTVSSVCNLLSCLHIGNANNTKAETFCFSPYLYLTCEDSLTKAAYSCYCCTADSVVSWALCHDELLNLWIRPGLCWYLYVENILFVIKIVHKV